MDPENTATVVVETLEELRSRHKKEQKDLVAKVTALKKTATKGDKKKKKEVLAEVAQLEQALSLQQQQEVKALLATTGADDQGASSSAGVTAEAPVEEEEEEEEDDFDPNDIPIDHLTIEAPAPAKKTNNNGGGGGGGKKPNRQKARKDRKAQQLKEIQDEAEKEAAGQVNMNEVERKAIEELAQVMNVTVKDVTADGHCLYNAIADQLAQHYQKQTTVKALRHETADYMRENADDFLPFLTNKQGDMMTGEDFTNYCKDLETTAVWGGQPELLALSRVHKVPIWVVQMGSPTVKLSADAYPNETPLMVSYHRHMYGLGEHYNSLRPKKV